VEFPTKAIHIIVPYSAGGGFDTMARGIAPYLRIYLPKKVEVVIENVTGGAGIPGHTAAFNAEPDGHTIGVTNPAGLVGGSIVRPLELDMKKYSWIATINGYAPAVTSRTESQYKTIEDLVSATEVIKVAVLAPGSLLFEWPVRAVEALGINYKLVSGYKGTSDIVLAMMRGDVELGVIAPEEAAEAEFNLLMGCWDKRHKAFPDLPTATEKGYPEIADLMSFRVMAAPPDTPDEVLSILRDAFWQAINDKAFQEWAASVGKPIIFNYDAADTKNLVDSLVENFPKIKPILEKGAEALK